MKIERHSQIIRLISQYDIETQEELAEKLRKWISGYSGYSIQRYPGVETDEISKPGGGSAMRCCRAWIRK